jgi:hypothetical protein
MTQQHLQNKDAVKKLKELVKDVKVCMFATINPDYSLFSRPMHTIKIDDEGNVVFYKRCFCKSGGRIKRKYGLSNVLPPRPEYLRSFKRECIGGYGAAKNRRALVACSKSMVPGGVTDPALCLLKVATEEASYWDGSSSKFVVIIC